MHQKTSDPCTHLCLFFCEECAICVQDTAASYGVGALGGLMYLRLLNRSVDSVANSALPVGVAAGGQARFAIPVLLVLLFNRCLYQLSSLIPSQHVRLRKMSP